MMIRQPDWITSELVDDAPAAAQKKQQVRALSLLRFERYTEGRSVQILHIMRVGFGFGRCPDAITAHSRAL